MHRIAIIRESDTHDIVNKIDFDEESDKLTRSSSGSSGRSSSGFSSLSQSSQGKLSTEQGTRVNHHHFVNHEAGADGGQCD